MIDDATIVVCRVFGGCINVFCEIECSRRTLRKRSAINWKESMVGRSLACGLSFSSTSFVMRKEVQRAAFQGRSVGTIKITTIDELLKTL